LLVISRSEIRELVFDSLFVLDPVYADAHLLMTVAVAALGKCLFAELASEGTVPSVSAHVVLNITKLAEKLMACEALKDLILSTSQVVGLSGFPIAFIFHYHLFSPLVMLLVRQGP